MSISCAGSEWPFRKFPKPSSAFQGGIRSPSTSSRIDCDHGNASR